MAITRPSFKSMYLAEPVEGSGLVLVNEGGYAVLPGPIFSKLGPLINGQNTDEDIVHQLDGQATAAEVFYALSQLEKRGYVVETDEALPPNLAAYWEMRGLNATQTAERLATASVSVTALDRTAAEPFEAALRSLGMRLGDDEGMRVVVTDDYLRSELADINREMLSAAAPWMLVKLVGATIWVGPVFRPGETGCWECLAQRLQLNRMVERFLNEKRGTNDPFITSRAWLPTTLQAGAALAATEVSKLLAGDPDRLLDGTVLTLNTLTFESQRHILIRRPQCPTCGKPEQYSQPIRVELQSRKKQFTSDGGHRTMLPEQTVRRLERHVSPITGAITSIWRGDTGDNPVMHSYVAGHNFAHTYGDLTSLRRSLRTLAGGKGASDIQAKASALAEAIERYSCVFRGDEPRIKATYLSLGEKAIDPRRLLLYSEEQYRHRHESHHGHTLFQFIPEPFDAAAEIEWTPAWSLTQDEFKYVPAAYCYYNYSVAAGLRFQDVICLADSNGTAAGNTIEEAILQGFMEVVERDCVGIFWYNRIQRPAVDLESFDDPYFRQLAQYLHSVNRRLHVIDITNDLGVPAFCGVTWRTDRAPGEPQEVVVGFGAHFDAHLAMMRALTECNQFLSSFEYFGETDNRYVGFDPLAVQWWRSATLENQAYLVPDASLPVKQAADYARTWSDDLRDDVEACVRIAGKHGLEMLVLDHTHPELDLNVARVIVPGARHFWQRFAPGRLYDVPVKLGWLEAPLTEADLNPFPVFF